MKFYSSGVWQRLRRQALQRDGYVCQWCLRKGVHRRAVDVHHIVPTEVDMSKALELDNLVSLCRQCHETTKDRWPKAASAPQTPDGVRVIRID